MERIIRVQHLLLGAAALALASCADDVNHTPSAARSIQVGIHVVSKQQVGIDHRAPGAVLSLARAELATRLAGRLTQISVRAGDPVERGQLLARIDAGDLNAALAGARAHLAAARAGLDLAALDAERAEALLVQQAVPQQVRDRAVATHEQALAAVEAAQRAVDGTVAQRTYGVLRAPFSGVVVRRLADIGDLTSPGMPVLVVERTDSVRVVAAIPESHAPRVTTGDSVRIDCGTTSVAATVHSVVADEITRRMFQVQVLLPAESELQAGRFAHLTYQTGTRTSLRLPREAIVTEGQLQGAFVVRDGRALLRWLRLAGVSYGATDGSVEVLSGLHAGDSVAVGGPMLRDGALVTGG
jgi:RND family efflux transporter MFP subunit